ncbi:mitochondrial ribosomal protein subunit L20-domain-containing protein [Fomitopsis serialis]|uniref:mitochondrial ribosomal protein subunit L20-domain-containing protein n=1 Tax=Fomitopsis serialis TaxID=139415 RepID=UPI0020081673|nr:mitochondrial ribosomal protein subunit L20-domain-containing protein [Neoantrodia serialis]KAH9936667.1 mitochondrial ribosomal protein subunit L20-domain-containing protein [Neoantrodia serialis]
MSVFARRLRLPSSCSCSPVRTYATRIPERPPYRAPDPLVNNPNATYTKLEDDLTFIHRPPPTAPSPWSYTTQPASPLLHNPTAPADRPLPPLVRAEAEAAHPRMSAEDIAKMRALRAQAPERYSRARLAKMFNCSTNFVAIMAPTKMRDRKKIVGHRDELHEAARSKWGVKRSYFEEARKKRKGLW